jgi:preprotein translocase subunit SecD
VAPPSTKLSRPWRPIAALAVIVVIMLAGVIGSAAAHPGSWHKNFRIGLGLDLSSGTTVTLKAVTPDSQKAPSQTAMNEARSIILNRVNGAGFTGAQVQQQGPDIITVAVPGKGAQQVESLVGRTALLRFRQVLLVAPNRTTPAASPSAAPTPSATPTPSPSASPSGSATPSATKSSKKSSAKAAVSPAPSSGALGAKRAGSGGQGLAASSSRLAAAAAGGHAKTAATATPASSPTPSAGGSPGSTASPPSTGTLSTVADGQGNASLVSPAVKALFNKLNCDKPNWQQKIYGPNSLAWDDVNSQIVACYQGEKYVLDKAPVTGEMLSSASAGLNSQTGQWQVNLNFNGVGAKNFGTLSSSMYTKYYNASTQQPTSVLDQFAIVLDGVPVSVPDIIAPITTGQGQITGSFTESQADYLANVLTYGHLPLSFQNQSTESISAELGAAQLHAGLVAGAIGLLLVVAYSFLYYRGLGLVSVSSLAIAALLALLSVVLLSKYENFTLNLAGVAGLIVAIGITADSFVVFFERLRDEVREGRSLRPAVERGWKRARRTILVSDTVSFLAAALLYYFSIGDVKGFAFTLGLTTVIDIVVVFLFTKPMVTILARTKFYGEGHPLSGLDPARLGARSPWRGSRRPVARPATGGSSPTAASPSRTTPKEA